MSRLDQFLGFFTGDNKEVANDLPSEAKDYVDLQLSDAHIAETLSTVARVVDMKNWLFIENAPDTLQYENASLEDAILAGEDVLALTGYMRDAGSYEGVELNDDVLKTVLTHFLNTIEPYELDAHHFQLEEIFARVEKTPLALLKYVIEERQEKLDRISLAVREGEPASPEFARRIFEYDLLLQRQGSKSMGENGRVNAYARTYANAVYLQAAPGYTQENFPEESVSDRRAEEWESDASPEDPMQAEFSEDELQ